MVNLLFISNSSKIENIKNSLQPLLSVKIDIVGDFDYGLKDVFEKRPAIVFIQDQIAGVTGESVARHIQLLLGPGAPLFIFMHQGNLKARPIKGLYEYLVDLSQDDTILLADIQSSLRLILGPNWQKVYVPHKAEKNSAKVTTLTMPEEQSTGADQLVEELLSDLGSKGPATITSINPTSDLAASETSTEEPFCFVSSPQDQLAEIISENARERQDTEAAIGAAGGFSTDKIFLPSGSKVPASVDAPPVVLPESPGDDLHAASQPESPLTASPEVASSIPAAPTVQNHPVPEISGVPERLQSSAISPADFRIDRDRKTAEDATECTLRDFEANYISRAAARKRYQVVATVLLLFLMGGGLYLVRQKTPITQPVVKDLPPAIVPAPVTQPAALEPVVQNSTVTSQKPVTVVLPSFIPLEGHDRLYASEKPGWERYVGAESEFRVFCSADKLKAVQVLATKGHVISESRLRAILIELAGTGDYQITSREQKDGFQVSRATVKRKTELLIYRKKNAMLAFVVSLADGV